MIIKNILIEGIFKFIHIYFSDNEKRILENKFEFKIYKLYSYKRGNIMSIPVNNNDDVREIMDGLINDVENIINIDNMQLKCLDILEKIISNEKEIIGNNFKEYFENYYKEGNITKGENKGGPADNWFERVLRTILNKNNNLLNNTYEHYNEFVVPDIVEILDEFVLCLDGKTNNGDGDSLSNKAHLGVNQSTLNDVEFDEYVKENPKPKWGKFKGRISPFYKGKPCLSFIMKIVYYDFNNGSSIKHMNKNIMMEELKTMGLPTSGVKDVLKDRLLKNCVGITKCKEIHIFLIPHINTYSLYKKNIKRGGNKSKEEQRLEINDKNLVRVIKLD